MRPLARFESVIGCVVAAAALAASSTASAATNDVERVAAEAVARIRDAGIAARQRAEAIAAVPSVVYGVATDQQTMLDLTADELSIHAQPGEIVEVAQQQLKSGSVVSLRREGSGPLVHLPLATPGLHIIAAGDELYSIAVVQLQPRDRADVVRGLVGVARRVDLAPVAARLVAAGGAVELRAAGGTVLLGKAPASRTTVVVHPPLGADRDPELAVFAPSSLSSSAPLGAATLTLLAIGIAVGVVLFRRRRSLAAAVAAYPHRREDRISVSR